MKVGIHTLGCKVNSYESEYVISLFKDKGYKIGTFEDICDIYIINTCTVTNQSDSKSRKIINQAIRKNANACIVAMGCFIEANKDVNIEGIDITYSIEGSQYKLIQYSDLRVIDKNIVSNEYLDVHLDENIELIKQRQTSSGVKCK